MKLLLAEDDPILADALGASLAKAGFEVEVAANGAVAEYLLGQAEGDNSGALLRAQGYFIQAGYCVLPKKLEVAARWSYVDPDRDAANDLRTEVGGAVSYYFNKHNLKLQGDVANLHTQRSATVQTDEMQYRLQAQIIF